MKKWLLLLLALVLVFAVVTVCASAAETEGHTIYVQVLGEGDVIPGETLTVADGADVTLWFMPEKGYEVVGVYVDGFAASHALPLYLHCRDCEGCGECDWIDWSMAYAGIEDDDWDDWKTAVTLNNVCGDHLIYVQFVERKEEVNVPEQVPAISDYADLNADAWYAGAVKYALEQGLMNGVGDGKFAPDGSTTRAQIVTMLWRLEKEPAVKYDIKFTDVAEGIWYTDAVRWAAAEQIVTGSNGKFAPNDPVTREQLAAILWRYAKYKDMDVSVGENTNILSYNDAFDVAEYAYAPLQWACGAGVIQGSAGNLMPRGLATRAQTAAMLYRFLGE